jgi:hypothetical protein
LAIREGASRTLHRLVPRACGPAPTSACPGFTGIAVDAGAVCALAHTVLTQGGCPKACRVACNGRPSCISSPRRVCHEQVEVVQALAWAGASDVVVLGAPMVLSLYLHKQTWRQQAHRDLGAANLGHARHTTVLGPACRACGVGRVKDQGYVKRRANCLLLIRRLLCRCCVLLASRRLAVQAGRLSPPSLQAAAG